MALATSYTYQSTEKSSYSRVETLGPDGLMTSVTKKTSVQTENIVGPAPRRSVPRRKPVSDEAQPTPNCQAALHSGPSVIQPKTPTGQYVSKTSIKREGVEILVQKAEVPPPPKATVKAKSKNGQCGQDVAETSVTSSTPMTQQKQLSPEAQGGQDRAVEATPSATLELCRVTISHCAALAKCFGGTSGVRKLARGMIATGSLCRCHVLRNLREAGGVVTDKTGMLKRHPCKCTGKSEVVAPQSLADVGTSREYCIVVTETPGPLSIFEIRPSEQQSSSVPLGTDRGNSLSLGSTVRVPTTSLVLPNTPNGTSGEVTSTGASGAGLALVPASSALRLSLKSLTFE